MADTAESTSSQTPALDAQAATSTAVEEIETLNDGTAGESAEDKAVKEAAAKSLKERFKLKVDGEEFEEEIDWNDKERIKRALQMERVANKRMSEKANIDKDMRQLVSLLQTQPDAVLAELGHDVEKFAQDVLNRKLEEMQKSPEQKEKEAMQKELERLRKEAEGSKKAQEEAEMLRERQLAIVDYDNQIDEALANNPDLPKNSYVVKRIADLMMFALQNNMPNITVKDIVPVLKKEIHSEWGDMFSQMPEDILERVVGKDNINRVRKAVVKKQKEVAATAKNVLSTGGDDRQSEADKAKKKETLNDFLKSLGKR